MQKFTDDGWKNNEGRIMTPGSALAIDAGCVCPKQDNANGLGRLTSPDSVTFVVEGSCPVHREWPEAGRPQLAAAILAAGELNEARA